MSEYALSIFLLMAANQAEIEADRQEVREQTREMEPIKEI